MRFESQTHPRDDHVDRIADYSIPYGQAHAVSTRTRLAKGRCPSVAENFWVYLNVESAERRGDRPMSSSLLSSVHLLYLLYCTEIHI